MHTRTRLHMPNLNETGFKSQYVRVGQRKCLRLALPSDLPVLPGSPTVSIDKKGEVGVVEEKFTVEPLNMNGLGVFFPCDKVKGRISLIEKFLSLQRFQANNLEASGAGDAELRLEKVDIS